MLLVPLLRRLFEAGLNATWQPVLLYTLCRGVLANLTCLRRWGLQAVALAQRQQPAPPQQPEVQVVERVVEAVDPVTQYKLERMEGEVRELTAEREAMNRCAGRCRR